MSPSPRTTPRPPATSPAAGTSHPAADPDRSLLVAVVALAVVSVVGGVVSVATGLSPSLIEAMGPTGRLSVPVPMMLAQLVAAVAASGTRRRPGLVAAALLAAVEVVCVGSGLFDGGFSDAARTPLHVGYQVLLVTGLGVVGALAARRWVHLRRS